MYFSNNSKNIPTFINTTEKSVMQKHKPNTIGQNKKYIIINATSALQNKETVFASTVLHHYRIATTAVKQTLYHHHKPTKQR